MTAGTEVVCNDVVSKVEIEEKCGDGLETSDLNEVGAVATVDGNVGGNGDGNVGRVGKDESDDSSYVFVSGSIEVTAGDPGDTGGVNVDAVAPISDSADEVDQFKKEELGIEKREIPVDPLALETSDIYLGPATVRDPDVKAVKEEVNLENGSAADTSVVLENDDIAQDVNGHLAKSSEEEDQVIKSTDELGDAKGVTKVIAKMDDIVSGVTFDPESIQNPTEIDQPTVFHPDSTNKQADESESQMTITQSASTPDLINTPDESLSTPNPVRNTDCEVMVIDGPESFSTVVDKAECQVTADCTDKPSEDLECQVTADGTESFGTPIKEDEYQLSVDGSGLIGNSVENQECPVIVDGSESSDNHTEEEDSTMTVTESDGKSEECQELLVMSSKVNVEAEPNNVGSATKSEHQTELVLGSGTEAEVKVVGSDTVSEEILDSGLVQSEDFDAPVSGLVEKFDGIVEIGETQISRTDATEGVSLAFNAEKEKSEQELEKQVERSSETLIDVRELAGVDTNFENMKEDFKIEDEIPESQLVVLDKVQDDLNLENVERSSETAVKVAESVGLEANLEEMKEDVKVEGEIPESQIVVLDKVQDDLNLKNKPAGSHNEAEASLATETNLHLTHEDTASQHKVSSCIDGTQEGFLVEGSVEDVKILLSTDSGTSECKNGELLVEKDRHSLPNPDDLAVIEPDGIENVDVPDDEEIGSEVKDAPFGDHSTVSLPNTHVNPGTMIEFGSIGRHNEVIAVSNVVNEETKPACGADSDNPERSFDGSHGDGNSDKLHCPEVEDMDGIQTDEIHTSVEGSVSDAPDVQNEEADVLPYNFLIRIPRFEDETIRDQIRNAQLQVDEKTRLRDAIRVEIHGKRARLKAHNEAFHAAKLEETAARRLVRLKRQEIDSVQTIINRMKNAMSIEDIDGRIYNMEHMIQHETLLLKDEKQFIREIKMLKTLRDQLASNIGNHDEVQQALEQKDQIEESMKILRKELDSLKANVSKAEAAVIAAGKKYDEESRKERELQAQFRAADDVRQEAYAHLNSLKKQFYDKNQNFRMYKEDVMAARDFASRGDKDGLHRLCTNQVEAFMEQWNNNDDFRNEYVNRCSMNNTNRRQRTLEGGSLAPDDMLPVLPSNVNDKADKVLVSIPIEVKPVSVVPVDKQGDMVSSVETKHEDNKSIENASGQKDQTLKTRDLVKPTLGSDVMFTEKDTAIDNIREEQITLTKEEIELARKAEELRKEETAAKLKEQRRLEEKAKAAEALERKKRTAEKAQLRAELRARKEAEQKEKEREKRLRKKGKKKGSGEGSINGDEGAASSESSNEATTKEMENSSIRKKKSQKPPPHFFSKQLKPKPVPPPLAIRNRKRWQQWGKMAVVAVVILVLFLLGNTGFFLNLRVSKATGSI